MKELISKEDVSKALKLEKLKLKMLAPAFMKFLKLNNINEAYEHIENKSGLVFIDEILKEFHIQYQISESDLA
ncbi:MAG: hypothetical protein ACOVK9_05575, partial [Bacteroidia bacterium]